MVTETNTQPNDKSPKKLNQPTSSDQNTQTGKDGKYWSFTDVRGNGIIMNQADGHEYMKIKHGSDSSIELKPDGAVQFTAQNGQYSVVMGKNQITVTGAQDIVVQGGGSLKIKGDYNQTVSGSMNMAVEGNINMTGKSVNMLARGNLDIVAQNKTEKITGSSTTHAETMAIEANKGLELRSQSDQIGIFSTKDTVIKSLNGNITLDAKTAISLKAISMAIQMEQAASIVAGTTILLSGASGVIADTPTFTAKQKAVFGGKVSMKDELHCDSAQTKNPTGVWLTGPSTDSLGDATAGTVNEVQAYAASSENTA